MKIFISTKSMTFEEENNLIEHDIVLNVSDTEFLGYDYVIDLPGDDEFIQNTFRVEYKKDKEGKDTDEIESKEFIIREQETWNSFPLYEIINGAIVSFDYTQFIYFANTDRRNMLAIKINELYNISSELKILRKTLVYMLNELNLNFPEFFDIMNTKIEDFIQKNPKDDIK